MSARQLAEGRVAVILVLLGLAAFLGLLPLAAADAAVAGLLVLAGVALAVVRPRGNRLLGWGVAGLGALLLVAGLLEGRVILNVLTVLVAAVLLVAAWLKHQGKWPAGRAR